MQRLADTDAACQCVQLRGMRDCVEVACRAASREKACCAWRTIPAFEPLWPGLGPHIDNGRPRNVGSDRRRKTDRGGSKKGTEQPQIVFWNHVERHEPYINTSAYRGAHRHVKLFEFGNDPIPFFRVKRGHCVTPTEVPRVAIFPEVANFGTRGQGERRTPPFRGLGGKWKLFIFCIFLSLVSSRPPALVFIRSLWSRAVCSSNNTPLVARTSSPLYVKSPNRSIFLPQEVSVRLDGRMRWSTNSCTIHAPTSYSQTELDLRSWHNYGMLVFIWKEIRHAKEEFNRDPWQ